MTIARLAAPLVLLATGCFTVRYEPRAPIVKRSPDGVVASFERKTTTSGPFVGGRFIGSSDTWRYRVDAPPGSRVVPSGCGARDEVLLDGRALRDEARVDGSHELEVQMNFEGDRLGPPRDIGVPIRGPAGDVGCISTPVPSSARAWRRVEPFVLGAALSIVGVRTPRVSGFGGLTFLFGRWFDHRYLGARIGGGYGTCRADTCALEEDREVEGWATFLGLEARTYNRPFRLIPNIAGVGGYGLRVEQVQAWLPTTTGIDRESVLQALATLHFAFVDQSPGWAGEPAASRGMLDWEVGLGAAFLRDRGAIRGGLTIVLGISWMLGQ